MRRVELLVPASSLEVLKEAVIFGTDAVYIGGDVYGLRAKAKNFSSDDMRKGVELLIFLPTMKICHLHMSISKN